MKKKAEYTTGEVAKILDLPLRTAQRYCVDGRIPAHQHPLTATWKIRHEDLIAFMHSNRLDPGDLETPTKVWIVDDDPSVSLFVKKAIGRFRADLKVELLEDGYEALLKAGPNPPDLMILDVGLPGMSGKEVFRSVKNNRSTRNMRIVAISGDPDEADQMLIMGADAVLSKPFRIEDLMGILERFIASPTSDEEELETYNNTGASGEIRRI